MFKSFFKPKRLDHDANIVYRQIVEEARSPQFYEAPIGVPDSMEGRFELILAHLYIADDFLSKIGGQNKLRRAIQELLIQDMDRSLRELGIGDMSIGKQMKKVGAGMLGRLNSYAAACAGSDDAERLSHIQGILDRNIEFGSDVGSGILAEYLLAQVRATNAIDAQAWMVGDAVFGTQVSA